MESGVIVGEDVLCENCVDVEIVAAVSYADPQ